MTRASGMPRQRVRYSTLAAWSALAFLFVSLRSWRLTSYGLWDDEVFSVHAGQLPWSHLFGSIAADAVHPPLFYVVLKLWMAGGGTSLLWLKLLPLILSFAALLPLWLLCRDLHLTPAETTLAFWLITVNGYLIHYSQELRMYSLLMCVSLWSMWLFLRFLDVEEASFRGLVALLMLNVLLVYTHYFGWLFVGAEWLCVLLCRPRLLVRFSISLITLALLFAPWAYAVVTVYPSKGNVLPPSLHWISRPGWAELLWYLATLNGTLPWRHTTPIGLILFGALIALAFCRSLRNRQPFRQQPAMVLGVIAFPPILVAFIASQLMTHSMWGERYLIIVAIPYLLLVAVSLFSVSLAYLRLALLVLIVTWTGVAAAAGLSSEGGRLPWKSLAQHVIAHEGPSPSHRHVVVYTFEAWSAGPLDFAFSDLGNHQFDVVVTRPNTMLGQQFWVAFRDTTLPVDDHPGAMLKRRGCRIEAERSVHDGAQQVVVFHATC